MSSAPVDRSSAVYREIAFKREHGITPGKYRKPDRGRLDKPLPDHRTGD